MYRNEPDVASSSPLDPTEHQYQAIINSLRATLGSLDRLERNTAAGMHIQWAIDLLEQDRPGLKANPAPELS